MNILITMIDWLNGEEQAAYPLQHDGVYPMMSWRNLRVADTLRGPSAATLTWMAVIVMGVPMLVMI